MGALLVGLTFAKGLILFA
ncbi:MAG: hypothetical protein MZV64_03960 [Ignavibacteriales bacterium]|nr:hypothetical protein [Ignavibacteriales bacterium]